MIKCMNSYLTLMLAEALRRAADILLPLFFLDRVCSSVARTYCLSLGFLSRCDLRNATVSLVFVVWDKLFFVDEFVALL